MSKRKIDEVVTEARIARGKRARTVTREVPVPVAEEKPADEAKAEDPKPKKGKKAAAKAETKLPREELVVFAFRLKADERDLIHRAAGAAKASRYVRALSIAASRGDEKTVVEIVKAVKDHLAATAS